jgi:hypothetical protein
MPRSRTTVAPLRLMRENDQTKLAAYTPKAITRRYVAGQREARMARRMP